MREYDKLLKLTRIHLKLAIREEWCTNTRKGSTEIIAMLMRSTEREGFMTGKLRAWGRDTQVVQFPIKSCDAN